MGNTTSQPVSVSSLEPQLCEIFLFQHIATTDVLLMMLARAGRVVDEAFTWEFYILG